LQLASISYNETLHEKQEEIHYTDVPELYNPDIILKAQTESYPKDHNNID